VAGLNGPGFRVYYASGAADGIRLATEKHDYAAALIDVCLSDKSDKAGAGVAEASKTANPHARTVAVTCWPNSTLPCLTCRS
jgi:hypothetical protein